MANSDLPAVVPAPARGRGVRIRIWHLAVLVAYVAVAIVNIQDQRRSEPLLVGLASGGLAVFALVGAVAWWATQRFGERLRPTTRLILYTAGMSSLFLAATVVYLVIEYRYLVGHF